MSPLAPKYTHALSLYFTSAFFGTHVQVNARPTFSLERRASTNEGPLFGTSGEPSCEDIGQHMSDCGFASSIAAIAYLDPSRVRKMFTYSGDYSTLTSTSVAIYNPDTLVKTTESVSWEDVQADNDDKNSIWWPGAIDRAAVQSSFISSTSGSINPVMPSTCLSLLTGLPAGYTSESSLEAIWSTLIQSTSTPIVLQTLPYGASVLIGGHAYAVLNATEVDGVQTVGLFNPWGGDVVYPLSHIQQDIYLLHHLTNFDKIAATTTTSASKVANTNTSTTPASKATSTSPSIKAASTNQVNANTVENEVVVVVVVTVTTVVYE